VIDIQFSWERRPAGRAAERLRRLARGVLEAESLDDVEVHVLMTGDEKIRELNGRFRDRHEATDVLSFPDGSMLPHGRTLLGQVVISMDRARAQAARLGHSEVRELEELLLHGVLHLSGYDHTGDDGEMDALELRLRRELLS
jgi:probable rRNA maturation factor